MLKARLTRFQWSTEGWPASQGRQRVDILGESKVPRYFVFIEIEADRVGCARNIVKAWMYIEQNTDSGPVLLVSILSPFFASKNRSGKEEAFFVAAKAQKDTNQKLTYKYIENDEWPVNSAQYATVVSNMVAQIDDFITGYERLLS